MNIIKVTQRRFTLSAAKYLLVVIITALAIGCGGGGSTGFDSDFHLIIPQTPVASGAGDIDGLNTGGDAKWGDAFDIQLIDGVPVADNHFWGVADASYLYLYFATAVDDFNNFDAVVIALSPTSDPTQKHLLVIYPCHNTGSCVGTVDNIPTDIDYYTDPDGDNTYTSTGAAHNVIAEASVSELGGEGLWAVEIRIPRGAPFNLPATGFFGLYAGVLDYDLFAGNVFQYTWPFNNAGGTTLLSGTINAGSTNVIPLQAHWGNASLDASLPTGVSISSQDISTDHGSSVISINEPNIFTARAHNHGTTSAQAVQATFQLANFGLPAFGSWESIGTSSVLDINPTATQDYTLNWSVPPDRVDDYTDHDHQCIRVQLSSTNMTTSFINNSAQRNMDFVVTSSPFVSKPSIATAGYHLAEQMRQEEFIIRQRFYNYYPKLQWESRIEGAKKIKENIYQLSIPIKQSKDIGLAVQPPEASLVAFEKLVIPAVEGMESKIVKVPVKEGKLITLVPNLPQRDIDISRRAAVLDMAAVKAEKTATYKATKDKQYSAPAAVYASWDGFKESSFIVSPGTSLLAPKGAKVLYVKQQAIKGQERSPMEQTLNIYVTDTLDLPRHLRSTVDIVRDKFGFVGFGANLPTAAYFGYRKSPKTLEVDGKSFSVYEPAGSFGYVVKGRKADQ